MLFQTSSLIESISTRSDNTLKIVLGTQELTPEQAAILFSLKGKQGWTLFKENEVTPEEVPEDDAPDIGGKSASQRLRDRMLVYFSKKHGNTKGFQTWYEEQLEMFGQRYLAKVEELKDYETN